MMQLKKFFTRMTGIKFFLLAAIILSCLVLSPLISFSAWPAHLLPTRAVSGNYTRPVPEAHIPEFSLSFDSQGHNQCAGYAAAFVQRYFGQETYGARVYEQISYQLPFDIGVPPHRLLTHFEKNNLKAAARLGNLQHIKHYSAREIPVIVLVGEGIRWQHYMVLLGYNQEKGELYFYDSEVTEPQFNRENPGNRTLSEQDFLKIWQNRLPGFSQLFITVEPRDERNLI